MDIDDARLRKAEKASIVSTQLNGKPDCQYQNNNNKEEPRKQNGCEKN